jgi:hypothetical protein
VRVVQGQGVVERVSTGDNGRALFICTAPGLGRKAAALQMGRIETTTVQVPHAGWP